MSAFLLNLFFCSLLYRPVRNSAIPPIQIRVPNSANAVDKSDKKEPKEDTPLIPKMDRRLVRRSSGGNVDRQLGFCSLLSMPGFVCFMFAQAFGTLAYISSQALIIAHTMSLHDHTVPDKGMVSLF